MLLLLPMIILIIFFIHKTKYIHHKRVFINNVAYRLVAKQLLCKQRLLLGNAPTYTHAIIE
jgi:hypothetical protein